MHLLFVSQDFPPASGGIQTYAYEISRRLAPRCERMTAVVPKRLLDRGFERPFGARMLRLPVRPDLLPVAAAPILPILAARGRFDVAFHAQWQTAAAALVARRLTGFPRKIVVAAHGRELTYEPNPLVGRLRPVVLARVDHFVAVSAFTADLLESSYRVKSLRISVVPNGTDPDVFRPEDASDLRRALRLDDRPVLLTVSRLVPHKGIDTTLRSLPAVRAACPDVRYLVAGTGSDRSRLERLADELGVADCVKFVGDVHPNELSQYYNACDVFVMPSRAEGPNVEGFGIVYLEANACGKPVIGGRSGGTEDAVVSGETGLLVRPDDPEALAGSIIGLLNDSTYRERLGAQGRARVLSTANWDRVAERVLQIIRREAG